MGELSRYDAQVIDNILCDIGTCTQKQRAAILESLRGTVVMGKHDDRCLNCGSDSIIFNWDKFCPQCGQRIKREE